MAAALQTLILVIPRTSGVFKVSSMSLQDWGLVCGFGIPPLLTMEVCRTALRKPLS